MAFSLPTETTHSTAPHRPEGTISAPLFDTLCRSACAQFSVPWALIHLNRESGQPGAIGSGLDVWESAIAPSFRSLLPFFTKSLVVEDATHDPRFGAMQSMGGVPPIGFYASVPLFIAPDIHVGTLCLMDSAARLFTPDHVRQLDDLARIASSHLEMAAAVRKASEQEALYRLLAENSTDTIVRGNLDGVRLYISPAVRTLLGYEPEELIGRRAAEIVHPDDAVEFRGLMTDVREGRIDVAVSEQRQRHKDGSWVWLEAFVKLTRNERGEADGYVASVRDVSRRKEIESRLAHVAAHDPLTGLPNRALMHDRLAEEVSRARRTGAGFAVHCLDLDRFKHVNDEFGHEAGDLVLRTIATRFRVLVRAEDTVARLGGDEFVVIQTATEDVPASAMRLADRLIRAASEPIDFNGMPLRVGLSIGIAIASIAEADGDGLLRAADKALYEAKEAGRSRYCVFGVTPKLVQDGPRMGC